MKIIEKLKQFSIKNLLFIILFIIFGVVIPLYYLNKYICPDESTFLSIGGFIRNGALLYRDVADIKPPGIFYLAAFVTGKSFIAARILTFIVQIASAILIFILGKKIANKNIGMIASILYLGGVYTYQFQGFYYLTEPYSVFFILVSVLFFFKEGYRNKFISGLALGIAILFKQTSFLLLVVFFLFYLLQLRYKKNKTKKYFISSINNLIIIFFSVTIPFLIALFYFFLMGAAREMLYYSVFFISEYGLPFHPSLILTGFFTYFPVWLLSICMILIVGYRFLKGKIVNDKHLFLIIFLLILSIPALIIMPGHRVLYVIPPASLLAALFISDLFNILKRKNNIIQLKCFVMTILLITTVIAVGTNMYMDFFYTEKRGSIDDQIQSVNEIELYIDDEIYAFPYNNELYLFSNLRPGIPYLGGVFSKKVTRCIISDLRENNVSYIVANRQIVNQIEEEKQILINPRLCIIYDYIIEHYEMSISNDKYIIYRLKIDTSIVK